jgi:PAS domain S-box-containing protein
MTEIPPDFDGAALPHGSVLDVATLLALLEHAHDAVFVRRLDGEILYWNKGAERTYGWTSEQARGQILHALLNTRFPKPLVVIEEALHEHGEWEGRLVHTRRDGRQVVVESRWALDRGKADATVLEINRDMTPRLEAQEAVRARERQLRFVTDNAPVAIAHCDPQNRFKFVNRPYAERFGLHPAQLVGRTVADVIGEQAFEAIRPYTARALAGEPLEVEVEIPYEKLGRQYMHFAYVPELDDAGAVVGYVAAVMNVSDRRRAEEALLEADRRKDAFLATLAHELRNPLAALRNAVALVTGGNADPAGGRRASEIIERQLRQLVRLVDDLLDMSRITRGLLQLRVARVALADIIHTALESTALATGPTSQTVIVALPDEPVFLDADVERLAQVFGNLLTNAMKYTPPEGRIALTATATEDEVTVVVEDSGAGIPSDMLESVFGMFTQVERTRDRAYGGLGIGLTLVRMLVALHNGAVSAHSEGLDRGSRFVVRLPRATSGDAAAVVQPAASTPQPARRRRVLIADDNADAAESLQLWLEMAGHEVSVALDGVAALAKAEAGKPEVVLLDLGMPGLTGYDVARRIREAPWGREMVLVALTGWGQDEDRKRTREAGFDHHLTKPVPPDEIEELVQRC